MTSSGRRHGISIIWATVALLVFCGLASLAVDYGRAQVAKSELRRAADAAARAAASAIGEPARATGLAQQYAAYNKVDGKPVQLTTDGDDVQFVTWDSKARTYKVLVGAERAKANAVRVCARASVPLVWASLIGKGATRVQAVSICAILPASYGIIGLESISMNGNTSSSYWSATGNTGGNAGNIASNGNITLTGGATVNGNTYSYGGDVTGGTINGTKATLTEPLAFPSGDASAHFASNNNAFAEPRMTGPDFALTKNGNFRLPGGVYVFRNFSSSTGSKLTFDGPATIYCYGSFTMNGQANTNGDLPKNLRIVMCPGPSGAAPGDLTITGGSALYASIYAPQSVVTITGNGSVYGSVLGRVVDVKGTGEINYDLSLTSSSRGSAIAIVQ